MTRAILTAAYPGVAEAFDETDKPIAGTKWRALVATERKRALVSTGEWAAAVQEWWEAFSGGAADRTAALRRLADVTIPGEPRAETAAQQRLFEAEERRMMDRVADVLGGAFPRQPPPNRRRRKPRKKR